MVRGAGSAINLEFLTVIRRMGRSIQRRALPCRNKNRQRLHFGPGLGALQCAAEEERSEGHHDDRENGEKDQIA